MTAVEIRDLTKQYGEVLTVDGLDLELREGEVFGLLGPNGRESQRRLTFSSSSGPQRVGAPLCSATTWSKSHWQFASELALFQRTSASLAHPVSGNSSNMQLINYTDK
jgi:ABC-type hemin transport system ATPase subunit